MDDDNWIEVAERFFAEAEAFHDEGLPAESQRCLTFAMTAATIAHAEAMKLIAAEPIVLNARS